MDEWFKIKRYPHIGLPIAQKKKVQTINYIKDAERIIRHQFRPLIQRKVITYPHRREKNGKMYRERKERLLTFASHLDSNIYSYYASKLQDVYENFVQNNDLDNVVVAYRKIKTENGTGNKCNIHIANDVFSYIKDELNKKNELAVLTFDIKGFFDNLDHKIIKKTWKEVMGYDDMPKDEYAVYRSVIKYSFVLEDDIFKLFKNDIICEKRSGEIVKKKFNTSLYFQKHNVIAYCDLDGIIEIKKRKLLKIHDKEKGIPQGLPISAVLANIYMKNFDLKVNEVIKNIGGIYKRYSDDIIAVVPIEKAIYVKSFIMGKIKGVKLNIENKKTNLYGMYIENGNPLCLHEVKGKNKPIEYLGFSFDGEHILLKSASLCKYYNKMYTDKRRHKYWCININNNTVGILFTNQIVRRFTFAGAKRNHIRIRMSNGKFQKTDKKNYGNYLTYALKATEVMHEDRIKKQLRRNLNKVRLSINEIKEDTERVLNAQKKASRIYFN